MSGYTSRFEETTGIKSVLVLKTDFIMNQGVTKNIKQLK